MTANLLCEFFLKNGITLSGLKILHLGNIVGLLKPTFVGQLTNSHFIFHYKRGKELIKISNSSEFLNTLKRIGLLIEGSRQELIAVLEVFDNPIYSRNAAFFSLFYNSAKEIIRCIDRLKTARVVVFGCGGLGIACVLNAAGLGIRHFRLIDGDKVELSNLNRQFAYQLDDIGHSKVHVLSRFLTDRFSGIDNECYDVFVQPADIDKYLDNCDCIIFSADYPPGIASICESHAINRKIPFVYGGYMYDVSLAQLGCLHESTMLPDPMADSTTLTPETTWLFAPERILPSVSTVNADIGAIMTHSLTLDLAMVKSLPNKTIHWTLQNR